MFEWYTCAAMMSSSCNAWFAKRGVATGLLILRAFVAFIFIRAGAMKLFGGMDMFTGMVAGIGFPAPAFFAYAAALIEFIGGIAVLLGVGTRVFSALIAIVITTAFFGAHDGNTTTAIGPFVLIGATLALAFAGSGPWAIGCPRCRKGGCCCCGIESGYGCNGNCACGDKKGKDCCKH